MKKVISLFLSLIMIMSIIMGFDASVFGADSISYKFDSETGTLTISGTGSLPNYKWTVGELSPYYSDTNIKKLVIGDGITYVGRAMFLNCSGIEEIIIPYNITYCLDYQILSSKKVYYSSSFHGCSNIKKVTLTKGNGNISDFSAKQYGICHVGDYGFLGSEDTNSIVFTPWYISRESLVEVKFEEGVPSIAQNTLYSCSNVKSITIPSTVEDIQDDFSSCDSLEEICVSNDNPNYDSSTGALINKNTNTLLKLPQKADITDYEVPETVTLIADSAFNNCSELLNISIHDNVIGIGTKVFDGTAFYNLLNNWNDGVLYINNHLISVKPEITDVKVKGTCKTLANDALGNCVSLNRISFLNKETMINCSIPESAIIGGYIGSTAYAYATVNNRTFDDLSYCEHTNTYNNIIKPTCNMQGKNQVLCSNCEKLISQTIIPATGHSMVIEEAEIPPTCTTDGKTESGYCSKCDYVLQAEVIPAKGHTPAKDVAISPTLISTGLTEGSHCSVCGEVLVAQEVVPALIPEGASVAVNGDKAVITLSDGSTITVPKDTKETVKNADGTYTVTLNDGSSVTVSSNTEITKTADGQINVKATDNDKTTTVTVPSGSSVVKSGDSYTVTVINGTEVIEKTVAAGETVVIDKSGSMSCNGNHKWDNGAITIAPSYVADGVKTYTCTVCGNQKIEKLAKLQKKANTLSVKAKKPSVKFAKLKKKKQSLALKKWATVSNAKGAVSFKKTKGNKKITVAKNGKITLKKGLKKGTYKIKIQVTAAGNTEYNASVKTVTVKIKVK